MIMQQNILNLSFYGFAIQLIFHDEVTLANIRRDFSFFVTDTGKSQAFFEVFPETFNYEALPHLKASFYTPRNICYRKRGILYIDYFGRGLSIVNTESNNYKIYSSDAHLRHEIVFLSILSLVGQILDSRHIHRVHGLGLEIDGKAVLILLPKGGGKTTLLLELLKNENIKLISEDSPLIDNKGQILPFPIRIGISSYHKHKDIPEKYLYLAERMEFEPKYLLDIEYFKDKIASSPTRPCFIFHGIRCVGADSAIQPVSRYHMLKAFVVNSVIGMGLYQGVEFLLNNSAWDIFKKSKIAYSRFINSCKVISQSQNYSFLVGSDSSKNVRTLLDFFSRQ